MKVARALFSVSNKHGVVEFGFRLARLGIEILSTGGTAEVLRNGGVPVVEVSKVTGFAEMMDGRVKTLHPKIHGGILAQRDNPKHMNDAKKNGIGMIDLVVVNLYPFEETVVRSNILIEDAIEQIDIGGPAMVRSAGKNFQFVSVLVDPDDYKKVAEELEEKGVIPDAIRKKLCVKAFRHTAYYDTAIGNYLEKELIKG